MSDFKWPEGRLLTLQELKAAYESGALHSSWSALVGSKTVRVYAPLCKQDRAKWWQDVEESEMICILREESASILPDLLGVYGVPCWSDEGPEVEYE